MSSSSVANVRQRRRLASRGSRCARKREKYTRVACESCKARKVKCSGNIPCSRCLELDIVCNYTDYVPRINGKSNTDSPHDDQSKEPKSCQHSTSRPQPDLSLVLARLNQICNHHGSQVNTRYHHSDRNKMRSNSVTMSPGAYPMSPVHTITIAQQILGVDGSLVQPQQGNIPPQINPPDYIEPTASLMLLQAALPILELGYKTAQHYLSVFTTEVYPMYPCVKLESLSEKLRLLFQASSTQPLPQFRQNGLHLDPIDVEILKVVLAMGVSCDHDDPLLLGKHVEAHFNWCTGSTMEKEMTEVEDVVMSTLLTIYNLLHDKGLKAWKMAGLAAKFCLELGLHKAETIEHTVGSEENKRFLMLLMSCVYDLDSRCSLVIGLPRTIHDADVDPEVLYGASFHPYLSAMVRLDQINYELSSVFQRSCSLDTTGEGQLQFIDFRVQKLAESIDQSQFTQNLESNASPSTTQTILSSVFQLRVTQIRIMAHASALSSSQVFKRQPQGVRTLISLAKHTVTLYEQAVATGTIPRLHQETFDKILASSVSYMFLAVCYSPHEYGPICRDKFYTAVDLLSKSNSRLDERQARPFCRLDNLQALAIGLGMSPTSVSFPPDNETAPLVNHELHPDSQAEDFFETLTMLSRESLSMPGELGGLDLISEFSAM